MHAVMSCLLVGCGDGGGGGDGMFPRILSGVEVYPQLCSG